MLKPALTKMRNGIIKKDMGLVAEGFFDLTGEDLTETETHDPETEQKTEPETEPETRRHDDFIFSMMDPDSEKPTKKAVKAAENTFIDDGSDGKDIKTPEIERVGRNRPPPKYREVTCHVCGKKEEVHAVLSQGGEFYRCNECV